MLMSFPSKLMRRTIGHLRITVSFIFKASPGAHSFYVIIGFHSHLHYLTVLNLYFEVNSAFIPQI